MRGELVSWISPPSSRDSSRLMARPRPVPPYLRLVLPSACWNASKMICCLSPGMPMPVSLTLKATVCGSVSSMLSATWPRVVNLKALDNRFLRICCRRLASVIIDLGRRGSSWMRKSRFFDSATWLNARSQ